MNLLRLVALSLLVAGTIGCLMCILFCDVTSAHNLSMAAVERFKLADDALHENPEEAPQADATEWTR